MRMLLFHVMVVTATVISFFFADLAPFGCCSRGGQPPQNINNTNNADENPQQGFLFHKKAPSKHALAVCKESKSQTSRGICQQQTSL
ncbi:MAG: hypothetical protein EP343_26955 [Deltaproteobacteria bacterium]|nr:MAG: hypothetical protein EP343_26955 [Deltaproteobacteria bacterium]